MGERSRITTFVCFSVIGYALMMVVWWLHWFTILPIILALLTIVLTISAFMALLDTPCPYHTAVGLSGGFFGAMIAAHQMGWHAYLVTGLGVMAAGILVYAISRAFLHSWTHDGPADFQFFGDGH